VSSYLSFESAAGRWVLAVTVLGSGIAFLESTVVNIALPTIGEDLDAGVNGLQWIINGYLLTVAALILLGGSLGDRYGRRRMFIVGLAWFTIASALCAAAPNVEVLIVTRILQGVGGAILTPGSLAIIEASFKPEERARAIGAWSGLVGAAAAVGPLVGGYLIDAVGWRSIFLINLPIGAAVIAAAIRHVPESRNPDASESLDLPGSLLVVVGLAGITFGLIQFGVEDASGPLAAMALAIGVGALAGFALVERRRRNPMLPLEIFRSDQFVSANLVTFVVYGAFGAVFFLLVLVLQNALGYSALAAGMASLPITALLLLLSARAGAIAQRIGPRIPLTVGPLLIAAGMLLMTRIDAQSSYLGGVLPALIVFGLGLAATVAPITATALAAASEQHAGIASGVNNAVSRTAQLIVVAALPLLVGLSGSDYEDPVALTAGFHTAMVLSAIAAAFGGLLAWLTIDDDVLERAAADAPPIPERHCAVAGTPIVDGLGEREDVAAAEPSAPASR
jgi:EmrB/QacA subfamily drug resistance transporter